MVLMFVDLLTRLSQANVIIGIILCALGLGLVLLSRKITKTVSKNENPSEDEKAFLICRTLGLVMICTALIIMIIQ